MNLLPIESEGTYRDLSSGRFSGIQRDVAVKCLPAFYQIPSSLSKFRTYAFINVIVGLEATGNKQILKPFPTVGNLLSRCLAISVDGVLDHL